MDNLLPLALIIILLWLGALAYYWRVSRGQERLERKARQVEAMLDASRPDPSQKGQA
ncbi:MAG: hypothetical protein ACRDHL_00875 [Candidatus Promineifilaceae bacterium]